MNKNRLTAEAETRMARSNRVKKRTLKWCFGEGKTAVKSNAVQITNKNIFMRASSLKEQHYLFPQSSLLSPQSISNKLCKVNFIIFTYNITSNCNLASFFVGFKADL